MNGRAAAVLALATGCLLGSGLGWAAATDLGVTDGLLETSSAAITAACGTPNVVNADSTYLAGQGYRISSVRLNSIEAACRSKPYSFAEANDSTGYPQIGGWDGTTPGSQTGTITPADRTDAADVNSVNTTNNGIQVFLLTRTS